MTDQDIIETVKTIGGAIMGILLVAVILSAVFGFVPGILSDDTRFEPAPEEYELVVDDDRPADLTVSLSDEREAVFDANESYIEDPTADAVWQDDWAVALTVREPLDDEINRDATYTLYAADNETVHILYEAGNWTARYNDGDQSAVAQASVTQDPIEHTPIVATWDETAGELALYVDGDERDTAALTDETVARDAAISWYGGIDEVRTYNATLDGAAASAYAAEPVQPIQPGDAEARLMFNDGEETVVYYSGGEAAIVGDITFGDGVGQPPIEEGTDYELTSSPTEFRAVEGGFVDGAPVVFLSWADGPFAGVVYSVQSVGVSAFGLLIVSLLVLAATTLLREFGDGGFSR